MRQTIVTTALVAGLLSSSIWIPTVASAHAPRHGGTLNIVGYSTPGPVFGNQSQKGSLEWAFAKTKAGKGVTFNNSFGPSDSQSQALAGGLEAEVVNFSYAPNIQSLVAKKLVPKSWDQNQYHGNITDSVVAFGVRPGNPKHLKSWHDLVKRGVQVVTPSAAASGSAKWNVLAAYGAQLKTGHSKKRAVKFLRRLHKNISVEPTSGSKALAAFLSGEGDVVIGYEDDIMAGAKANPGKIKLVVPRQSLLIENPLSWTLPPASHNAKLAKRFVRFLYSKKAQTIWGKNYYWPVVKKVAKKFHFRKPRTLFNIRQVGGWPRLDHRFFAPNGIWTKIENGG